MRNRDELTQKSMKNRGGIKKEAGIEENLRRNQLEIEKESKRNVEGIEKELRRRS